MRGHVPVAAVSPLLAVALVIPTAGFLVRVFVVFHDCTHGSLLPSRRANRWAGGSWGCSCSRLFISGATSTPGTTPPQGILTAAAKGDVETLTVAEYQARVGGVGWPTGCFVTRW